jgi:hypothetical protein
MARSQSILIIISLMLIAVLSVFVYATGSSTSGENKELNIDLVPPEVYQYTSIYSIFQYKWEQQYNYAKEGTFSVESSQSLYKTKMSGQLTVRNLEHQGTNGIYEVWLIDVDTGFHLSLGLFKVNQDGDQRFSYSHPAYINQYDIVAVTREPFPDTDPRQNGEVVLVGYFDPSSLTKSSVSYGVGPSLGEYAQYGEDAETVYG